jgi:carbon-monoxide dehydrogenase small subunit
MYERRITVRVNGETYTAEVEPRLLLVDFLRDVVGSKGTRIGCDTTNCGCCTVLLDGVSVKSCTLFAVQADGREVLTVEGLQANGQLHPLQEAFWEHRALQCGYCTSGMLLSAYFLLSRNPEPTEEEIRRGIAGNLCRCTGYRPIIMAIRAAAERLRAGRR